MALNSRPSLDSRWVSHNLNVEAGFNIADIEIVDSNMSDSVYNAEANTWTGSPTVLWSGKARIQASSKSSSRASRINPTSISEVEVHFNSADPVDIIAGSQVVVTYSAYSPDLVNKVLVVRSSTSSTNAWNYMLLCEIDEEVRRSV